MHFSVTVTLALHFLFYHQVSSSRYSLFKNWKSSIDEIDDVLSKFFTVFNEVYLQTKGLRHVTIIGESTDELLQTQSLFEENPYITCTDMERCVYPEVFISGSFYIVFLDDLGEKTLEKNLKLFLPNCRSEFEFLFVYKGSSVKSNDISTLFTQAISQGVVYPELAHIDNDTVKIYRHFIDEDCLIGVKSVFAWKSGTDSSKIYFPVLHQTLNMKECPISVGTIASVPKMVTQENENGSTIIVGGAEGMLVLFIAEALNFTPVVKYPQISDDPNVALKESMISEVASGVFELGIGRLRPINTKNRKVVFSKSYDDECITWGVSHRMSTTANLVWAEFPLKVWALIGSVFVITCVIVYTYRNINFRKNGDRKGIGFCPTVLDVLAMNLGNPMIYIPISTGSRSMLILHLLYSTIVTTGYKTSLASILATEQSSTTIFDVQGIIEANLKAGGSRYNLNILKNYNSSSKFVKKLIERYEVIHNSTELMHRLKFDNDFACLGRRSAFSYEKRKAIGAQELINFDVFSSCVLTYSSVMVFREGSFLRDPVDKLIWKVIESGILKHLDSDAHVTNEILERINSDRFSPEHIRQKFENTFIFYCGCLFMCFLVFFIELITPKFKPKIMQHRVQRKL